METGTWKVKTGLAQMLKGGVIMDIINAEQAKIAEEAGACAVMALERVPSDIRAAGGVARMADTRIIEEGYEDYRRGYGGGIDTGDGKVPYRAFCGGAGAWSYRR